jgi:predicted acetyltransferase
MGHPLRVIVAVVDATPRDRPILRRLLELYIDDFSELAGHDVDPRGTFGYPRLDSYWTEADRHPFLLRVGGAWAGFALVRSGDPNDMAEFFVMRKYRREGVGRDAAQMVFDRFPGTWTVRQILANEAATRFWRSAIPSPFSESRTDTEIIQRFDTDT